jgi:hypothetical protein
MTFGQGKQLMPHRKRAAPPNAIGRRRTNKESRKQAKIMKRVMGMRMRTKKGMRSRENECV